MLVFNHDLDCFCIGQNKPRCAARSECMLSQVERNFKDVKNKHVQAEVEIIKKGLQEGITRSSLDQSVLFDTSATTRSFKINSGK
jgi:hypothetical protein